MIVCTLVAGPQDLSEKEKQERMIRREGGKRKRKDEEDRFGIWSVTFVLPGSWKGTEKGVNSSGFIIE